MFNEDAIWESKSQLTLEGPYVVQDGVKYHYLSDLSSFGWLEHISFGSKGVARSVKPGDLLRARELHFRCGPRWQAILDTPEDWSHLLEPISDVILREHFNVSYEEDGVSTLLQEEFSIPCSSSVEQDHIESEDRSQPEASGAFDYTDVELSVDEIKRRLSEDDEKPSGFGLRNLGDSTYVPIEEFDIDSQCSRGDLSPAEASYGFEDFFKELNTWE